MNEYIKGGIVGLSQVVMGHPFDTLKTLVQSKTKIKITPSVLCRGISYPLAMSTVCNSLIFGTYNETMKYTESSFIAGATAGLISSFIINPFDLYKIRTQTGINMYVNPMTGLPLTMLRESTACGIYFSTYNLLKRNNYDAFLSGGIAGTASWILTYPIDTLKTRVQSGMSLSKSIAQRKYWIGISYCVVRAFIANGAGFKVYESLQ